MSMKVEREPMPITHELKPEEAQPIIRDFVKGIGAYETEADLSNKDFESLNGPFAELFNVYKDAKGEDKGSVAEFSQMMKGIAKSLSSLEPVRREFKANKDVKIFVYSNRSPNTEGSFISSAEAHRTAQGKLIAFRIGNSIQSYKITNAQHVASQMTEVKPGEDVAQKFHGTVHFAFPEAKKTNIIARFFFGICNFIKNLVTFPFQTKTRIFLSSAVCVGLVAVGMQSGHIPHLPPSVATPLSEYTWTAVAYANQTASYFAEKAEPYLEQVRFW